MNRGGKRPGAGRPNLPADQRAVAITVRLRPPVATEFRAQCQAAGRSQSAQFTALVKGIK